MLIEIHMIQNHSPSNLNRDDLGAPKTCIFGDVTRARISSQCLKRSIRNPGNPENVHNRGPGIFAEAMKQHLPQDGVDSMPLEERLAALDDLRTKGLVNDDEYAAKRQQILDDL